MNKLVCFVLGALLIFTLQAKAAEQQHTQTSELPIEITAQQLEALQEKGQAIFTGNVVATQGDITLHCDRMVVFSQDGQQQVERLEAYGNVRVVQLDRTATADQAIYRQRQGTLVLLGNARLLQGQNQVSGNEITVYLQENRSVVKSQEGQRVKAVIFPETKQGSQ